MIFEQKDSIDLELVADLFTEKYPPYVQRILSNDQIGMSLGSVVCLLSVTETETKKTRSN